MGQTHYKRISSQNDVETTATSFNPEIWIIFQQQKNLTENLI